MKLLRHRFTRHMASTVVSMGAIASGFWNSGCGSEAHSNSDEGRSAKAEQALSSCVTVQRGTLGAVEDTTITPNVTTPGSMSTAPTIRIGGEYQALVKFDLSAVPTNVSVDTAVLKLTTTTVVSDLQLNANAAVAAWSESTVTFASFNNQTLNVGLGSIVGSTVNTVQTMTLKRTVVQDWLDGTVQNKGFLLAPKSTKGPSASKETIFVSSDSPTISLRPSLEVCFTFADHCMTNPCINGATCVSKNVGYTCTCAPGYSGTNCATNIDDCAGLPCLNGGTCTDGLNTYTCACAPGYTGANCEVDINECTVAPCQNGGTCSDQVNAYLCTCPPGFAGTNCETNIDECAGNPCLNGAVCSDGANGYTCQCAAGYSGPNCEINIDDCSGNTCQNGSTCVDGEAGYGCACVPGFSGTKCEVDVNDCAGNPCLNDGVCIDHVNHYDCGCAAGFTGTNCEFNINDCVGDPCENGGTCIDEVNTYSCECVAGYQGDNCETNIDDCSPDPCQNEGACTDGVNTHACACAAGYEGESCETNINDCSPNPCQHGGTCADVVGDYACTCAHGFSGKSCETNIDECAANPCQNGGTCSDDIGHYDCACPVGFEGVSCENNINDCTGSPCQNGGTCTDGVHDYTCTCPHGFTGKTCDTNVDDCAGNPCQHGGVCSDDIGHYDCTCAAGFEGVSCENNINECAAMPCQNGGSCTDGVNSYSCACSAGYAGTNCQANIDDCAAAPCQNAGTCIDGVNAYSCVCSAGTTGTNCETDIDECVTNNGGCSVNATCTNSVGSSSCACKDGYAGTGITCSDINECATNNGGCNVNATCTNTEGSSSCACKAGYSGNGVTCIPASCNGTVPASCGPLNNENCCASSMVMGGTFNQSNFVSASNFSNSPATVSNFRLDRFEVTVARFRKFVEAYPGNKPASGAGAHPLIAGSGWNTAWNANLPVDQAALKTAVKCFASYQTWTDTAGANETKAQNCLNWYETFAFCAWDGGRLATEAELNYAATGGNEQRRYPWSNPANSYTIDGTYSTYGCRGDGSAAGSCTFADILKVGAKSPKGDGKWGQADLAGSMKEWTLDLYQSPYALPCNNCANTLSGTERVNRGGNWMDSEGPQESTYRTRNSPTFRNYGIGARCARAPSETNANDCTSYPCQNSGACINGATTYSCICAVGYTGTNCETNIDDCASNPCQNGGGCADGINTYACACPDGYAGTNCEIDIDDCASNPCQNSGTCVDGINMYTCACAAGFAGTNCETTNWNKKIGFPGFADSNAIATKSNDHFVITGSCGANIDFGGGLLAECAGGSGGVFIAEFDNQANHIWSRGFSSSNGLVAHAVAADGAGNVVMAGDLWGGVDFGGGGLSGAGNNDFLLVKLDSSGNHVWSRRFGDDGLQTATGTAIDGMGNVVMTGYFQGTVDFGGGPLTCVGGMNVAVAKFDTNGNHLWSHRFGDTEGAYANHVMVDGAGNVVVTGFFQGSIDFGGGPLNANSGWKIFVAKFDPSGSFLWSRSFDGERHGAAVDGAGNVLLTGEFGGTVDFGGGPITAAGNTDVFVVKLSSSGNHLWSKRFGGYGDEMGRVIASDAMGNIVVAGEFSGFVDFGGSYLSYSGSGRDLFVVRLDPLGNHLWSKGSPLRSDGGGGPYDRGLAVAIDSASNAIVTGAFNKNMDFGLGTLVAEGIYEIFLARLAP